jgi:hypothetical protein
MNEGSESEIERRAVDLVMGSVRGADPALRVRAAMWWLERRRAEEWSACSPAEGTSTRERILWLRTHAATALARARDLEVALATEESASKEEVES